MTGANKKLNYPRTKTIKINENQLKNWNPRNIRLFLMKDKEKQENALLYGRNDNLDTQILKKLIPIFIEKDIEIDLLESEINRIEELYDQI